MYLIHLIKKATCGFVILSFFTITACSQKSEVPPLLSHDSIENPSQISSKFIQIGNENRYINTIFQNVQIEKDIIYSEAENYLGENEKLKLDMFLPDEDKETNRPAIILVHGGGFTGWSKDGGIERRLAIDFAKKGYVCASINYRLRPDPSSDWRGTIEDATTDLENAVTWLITNKSKYGVDVDHIAVAGYSAGGTTVLNLCYNGSRAKKLPEQSIFAVIDLAGGDVPFGNPTKTDPPCVILHGTEDTIVNPAQSNSLVSKFDSKGVQYSLNFIKGSGHNLEAGAYLAIFPEIISFLYKELTGKTVEEEDGTVGEGIRIKREMSDIEYNAKQINFKMDGKLDEWCDSELVPLDKIKNEDGKQLLNNDNSRNAMIGWNSSDPTHLYLAAIIKDTTYKSIHDGKTAPWENDTFEIMVDYTRNGKLKNFPLFDFIFDINGKDIGGYGTKDNLIFTVMRNGDQFTFEASIDLSDKAPDKTNFRLTAGDCIGAGILYNDWNANASQTYGWSNGTVWESSLYTKVIFNKP